MIIILQLRRAKFTEEDGSFHFKKHKIYLYKEDFLLSQKFWRYDCLCFKPQRRGSNFRKTSERFQKEYNTEKVTQKKLPNISSFTDIDFDDI
jgi:hypothetical protein